MATASTPWRPTPASINNLNYLPKCTFLLASAAPTAATVNQLALPDLQTRVPALENQLHFLIKMEWRLITLQNIVTQSLQTLGIKKG